MSKGKDFRGPRKRGFDDDGPMPYEPRPRPSRSFDGGGGGFGAPPSMAQAPATGPAVDAVVKWFKADKGYGFVELANGQGDAFLHVNALHSSGFDSVPPGAKLRVQVGQGAKGAQVTRVMEVDTAGAAERAPPQRSFGGGISIFGIPDTSIRSAPRLSPHDPHFCRYGSTTPFPFALKNALPHCGHFQSEARRCTNNNTPP